MLGGELVMPKETNKKLIIKKKAPKGEDGYRIFSIRIKESTVDTVDSLAQKSGRSRNELIGLLLEYAIDNCVIDSDY